MVTVGTDIVEVQRIKELIQKYGKKFLNRVYTPQEQDYCTQTVNQFQRYAGRFAAKEALKKAMQPRVDLTYYPFNAIEIIPGDRSVPSIQLLQELELLQPYDTISLSISHESQYAVAMVVIE